MDAPTSLADADLILRAAPCQTLQALRDWPAYVDCRKTIDDFLEMLPLFQALASKAMRDRHWTEVQKITGHDLNLAEDVFKLQHLLDCNILAHQVGTHCA